MSSSEVPNVERQPLVTPTEACELLDTLSLSIPPDYSGDRTRTDHVEASVDRLLRTIQVGSLLDDCANRNSDAEMRALFGALNRLESATATSWFEYYKPEESQTIDMFAHVYASADYENYQALDAILARWSDSQPDDKVAQILLLSRITEPVCESITSWMRKGQPALFYPKYIRELALSEEYVSLRLESVWQNLQRLEEMPANEKDVQETINQAATGLGLMLDNVLGIRLQTIQLFIESFLQRLVRRDDNNKRIPPDQGGGIKPDYWYEVMERYVVNARAISTENVERLLDECGIINLDYFTPEQLNRMLRFLDRDPELLERLQKSDYTVVITDELKGEVDERDYIQILDDGTDTTLYFGVTRDPREILRPLTRLRYAFGDGVDMRPTTVAFNIHGLEGWGAFADYYFGVPEGDTCEDEKIINLDEYNIGRLFRDYIRPHRVTGERYVPLLGCNLATNLTRTSAAEGLISRTNPADRIVVSASTGAYGLQWWDRGLRFFDLATKQSVAAHIFRLALDGSVQVSAEEYIQGLQ